MEGIQSSLGQEDLSKEDFSSPKEENSMSCQEMFPKSRELEICRHHRNEPGWKTTVDFCCGPAQIWAENTEKKIVSMAVPLYESSLQEKPTWQHIQGHSWILGAHLLPLPSIPFPTSHSHSTHPIPLIPFHTFPLSTIPYFLFPTSHFPPPLSFIPFPTSHSSAPHPLPYIPFPLSPPTLPGPACASFPSGKRGQRGFLGRSQRMAGNSS